MGVGKMAYILPTWNGGIGAGSNHQSPTCTRNEALVLYKRVRQSGNWPAPGMKLVCMCRWLWLRNCVLFVMRQPAIATGDCPDEKASLRDQGMASCPAMDGPISRTPQWAATAASIATSYWRGALETGNENPHCTRERPETRNVPDVTSRVTTSTTILSLPSPLCTPWQTRSITVATHLCSRQCTTSMDKSLVAIVPSRNGSSGLLGSGSSSSRVATVYRWPSSTASWKASLNCTTRGEGTVGVVQAIINWRTCTRVHFF